jgi:GDP/UDP-N,N'-diacetylbacillosamine 2-epimerase (hydrolysing)
MKKVAVVTGTRAEYGILLPVLKAIQARKELNLLLIATGMHLSHDFGYTVKEIEKDGFKIDARVNMLAADDTLGAMAKSIGQGIIGLTQTWEKLKPDIVVVLGDRVEPLAAAISGAYMNIPIAHIHGGDATKGGLDEYARHAITKFAHIHFPATPKSAERIIKLGEDKWRVHMVGSPALDVILNEKLLPRKSVIDKFGLDASQPLVMMVQHSITTEVDRAAEQVTETLEALVATGYPVITLYPNSDAGGRRILERIKQFAKKHSIFKVITSLPRREYLSLLDVASVLVGNSSSGIIDSPSFGVPAVNIGSRQQGRERGDNVIDVGYNRKEIIKAIKKALSDQVFLKKVKRCYNPYGDGKASIRIAEVLSRLEITPELIQKKITY